jgi:hypothetical protein
MSTNPELVDYLAFFEAEPRLIMPGMEWYYGVEFVSVRGPEKIIATLAPDEGEFSFKWWRDEKPQADLKFARVVNWSIENKNHIELLVLKFDQPNIPYFILQLKPHICVSWQVAWA